MVSQDERITSVEKEAIQEQLEPLTKEYYHEFYQGTKCSQIYWKGSHYPNLKKLMRASSNVIFVSHNKDRELLYKIVMN